MNRRVLVALLLAATPFVALAAPPPAPTPLPSTLPQGPTSVLCLIESTTNWIFTILLVLAVVFIVLAAYKYLFSGGGEETGAAHKMLIYAAVAVAVAMLSRGFVFVVGQLVGAPNVNVSCARISRTTGQTTSDSSQQTTTPVSTAGFYESVGPLGSGVSVERCSDSVTPAVKIAGQVYGNENAIQQTAAHPNAGAFTQAGATTNVQVQICSDGVTPHVIINNVRYPN